MLMVKIEQIIDNIIIKDNAIYFGVEDGEHNIAYSTDPKNKYMVGTDTYEDVQTFLFGECYLNFNSSEALEQFKNYCINEFDQQKNDYCICSYAGLHVILEHVKDPKQIKFLA